jgi:NhaA family Na+:H+ antiporter
VLRIRNRHYRTVFELETSDPDRDGVPDVYAAGPDAPRNGA